VKGRTGARFIAEQDLRRYLSQLLVQSRRDPEHAAVILRYDAQPDDGRDMTDREVAQSVRPADVCAKVGDRTWLLVAEVSGAAEAMNLADSVRSNLGEDGLLAVHLAHPWREASEVLSEVLNGTRAFPPHPRASIDDT